MQGNVEREVDSYLRRKYETHIRNIEMVHKEDLDLVCVSSKLLSVVCYILLCTNCICSPHSCHIQGKPAHDQMHRAVQQHAV